MLRCQVPLKFATKAFSYNLARFWASFCCKLHNISLSCMRISQNLYFFWLTHFQFFLASFAFLFFLPFYFLYLLPFIPFLSTGKVLASALQKTWKWNIDRQAVLRWLGLFHNQFCTKIEHVFFCYSSARIWSIFKMDTRMDVSVLAVFAAYQNDLVSSENDDVTSGSMFPDSSFGKVQLLTGKS